MNEMTELESEIREFSTKELIWHLKENQGYFDKESLVILCDEMLQREQKLFNLDDRFEKLVQDLKDKFLKYIDSNDHKFAAATVYVAIYELQNRNITPSQWFVSKQKDSSHGPYSRNELTKFIEENKVVDSNYIWKEGTEKWIKLKDAPYLRKKVFFDQEFDSKTEENVPPRENPPESKSSQLPAKSSANVVSGIMEFVSFPMWLASLIYVIVVSYKTELGIVIPLLFVSFATIASIPVGVGLLMRKKWAWSVKMSVGVIAIFLIALKMVFDDVHFLWVLFACYQALILAFIFRNKSDFEEQY